MSGEQPVFTDDQVKSLNEYQQHGYFHPFTCGNHCGSTLVATPVGWICPKEGCGYTQFWSHSFMMDGSWRKFFVPPWEEQTNKEQE